MRTLAPLLLLAMTLSSTGCASPDPRPEPQRPAQDTALARRLLARALSTPLVVAHRGASDRFPENTLPAFRAGLDAGADLVELDFRQTADGVLVCMHDATVDRTTDGARRFGRDQVTVRSRTSAEILGLDAGTWKGPEHAGTRVPNLAQALDAIQSGAVSMIEHKDGDPARLVALLREKQLVDDVLVQSFDWEWLAEVHRLEPRLTLGALGSQLLTPERLREIDALGVAMVHWSFDHLTLADVGALHERGYLVCVYTVDGDLGLLGCIEARLDAVTTDVPDRLRELVARRR